MAIVFLPGPEQGNKGPSMIKRLSGRELALGFMSATQGAYRPAQLLLDMSAGSRVALSLYDDDLPSGVRLVRERGAGRISRWPEILKRADGVPADIDPGSLTGAARASGRSVAYVTIDRGRNLEAIVGADRRGGVDPVELASTAGIGDSTLALWRSNDVTIANLPGAAAGYRALDALLEARRARDALIVIQTPPDTPRRLLAIGAAGLGSGTGLRSDSTHRAGLVVSTDLLPTVLEHVGVPLPAHVQGDPIEANADRSVGQISALRGRVTQVGPRRWKVTLGGLAIALAIIAAVGLVQRRRWTALVGRGAFLAALWVPAVLLGTGAFSTSRLGEAAIIGLACALLALLSERLVAWPRTPALAAAATVLAHLVDLAFGSGLIVRSLLGPNPILGARFYGIGNELEVTLAVATLVGIGAAVASASPRTRIWSFAVVGGAVTLLLSWGRLGADVGASITLGAGVATAVVLSLEGTSTRRRVAIVLATPAVVLGVLAAIDLLTAGDSHFTRSVLRAGGLHELGDVFQRKLESSYGSLRRGVIPLLSVLALAALVAGLRLRARLLGPLGAYPGLRSGLYGTVAAVVAGVLTNDSGPVILLIGTVYLALAVGYVQSRPRDRGRGKESPSNLGKRSGSR